MINMIYNCKFCILFIAVLYSHVSYAQSDFQFDDYDETWRVEIREKQLEATYPHDRGGIIVPGNAEDLSLVMDSTLIDVTYTVSSGNLAIEGALLTAYNIHSGERLWSIYNDRNVSHRLEYITNIYASSDILTTIGFQAKDTSDAVIHYGLQPYDSYAYYREYDMVSGELIFERLSEFTEIDSSLTLESHWRNRTLLHRLDNGNLFYFEKEEEGGHILGIEFKPREGNLVSVHRDTVDIGLGPDWEEDAHSSAVRHWFHEGYIYSIDDWYQRVGGDRRLGYLSKRDTDLNVIDRVNLNVMTGDSLVSRSFHHRKAKSRDNGKFLLTYTVLDTMEVLTVDTNLEMRSRVAYDRRKYDLQHAYSNGSEDIVYIRRDSIDTRNYTIDEFKIGVSELEKVRSVSISTTTDEGLAYYCTINEVIRSGSDLLVKCESTLVEFDFGFRFRHYWVRLSDYFMPVSNSDVSSTSHREITVYPNPTTDLLRYDCADCDASMPYTIYDTMGRRVAAGTADHHTIDVSSLQSGAYTLVSVSAGGSYISSFVRG